MKIMNSDSYDVKSKKYPSMPPNPQTIYGYGKKAGSCPKCGMKETVRNSLEQHIKHDHENTRPGTYTCWICEYTFKKQGDFYKHHKAEHKNEKMACWVCGQKNWSTISIMYGHINRDHPNYKRTKAWTQGQRQEGAVIEEKYVGMEEDSLIEEKYVDMEEGSVMEPVIKATYSVNPAFGGHFLAGSLGWGYDSAGDSNDSEVRLDEDGAPIIGHHNEEEVVAGNGVSIRTSCDVEPGDGPSSYSNREEDCEDAILGI